MGFDNPQFARAVHPKLTIINQPVDEIGEKAAEIMLQRLGEIGDAENGESDASARRHIWLGTTILEGRSVLDRNNAK